MARNRPQSTYCCLAGQQSELQDLALQAQDALQSANSIKPARCWKVAKRVPEDARDCKMPSTCGTHLTLVIHRHKAVLLAADADGLYILALHLADCLLNGREALLRRGDFSVSLVVLVETERLGWCCVHPGTPVLSSFPDQGCGLLA